MESPTSILNDESTLTGFKPHTNVARARTCFLRFYVCIQHIQVPSLSESRCLRVLCQCSKNYVALAIYHQKQAYIKYDFVYITKIMLYNIVLSHIRVAWRNRDLPSRCALAHSHRLSGDRHRNRSRRSIPEQHRRRERKGGGGSKSHVSSLSSRWPGETAAARAPTGPPPTRQSKDNDRRRAKDNRAEAKSDGGDEEMQD